MAGQQNYIDLDIETYQQRSREYLKKSSERFFLEKRFSIGEGVDKDKLRHYQMLYTALCSDEPQLIEWVDKKIKEDLCNKDCCSKFNTECYNEMDSCSVNGCFKWEKVEW